MTERNIDRALVLLSFQRALLGEVFSALRAITVEWSNDHVKFFAYIDGEPLDKDIESLSCISAEVASDLWDGVEVKYEIVRMDCPVKVVDARTCVFHRREYT